jgi:GNAT superfamily N-acetyltransferase
MTEYIDPYAARRLLNEASKAWATRDGQPWTSEEEDYLLAYWIEVEPQYRNEVEASQLLERTIEACRVRCEIIRKRLGIQVYEVTKRVVIEVTEVCPACWLLHRGPCDR